jgi:hypothetical protein
MINDPAGTGATGQAGGWTRGFPFELGAGPGAAMFARLSGAADQQHAHDEERNTRHKSLRNTNG